MKKGGGTQVEMVKEGMTEEQKNVKSGEDLIVK